MEIARLIAELSRPAAFPGGVDVVEVHQTHISVVFLAGEYAYKIKKPVDMHFLDFRTLELRRRFCEEEVRLNRRLAPSVYLGVVPIVETPLDGVKAEAAGTVVEWAVKMRRLPDDATLRSRVQHGIVDESWIRWFATKTRHFHETADSNAKISSAASYEVVAGNCRENFEQAAPQVGRTVELEVFDRIRRRTENELERLRPLIQARAARGIPRDTHGDLRLDHIYLFPDRPPPEDLVVIDCIEFNERFRFADPVADMAFVVMDLMFHGRRDLARAFGDAYFESANPEGRQLLAFYTAYRAVVRAKVDGFELGESEIPDANKSAALERSRAHWLLALEAIETPTSRPCLVLVSGLPGTGKSTLARSLAVAGDFEILRSDVLRKELAGISPTRSVSQQFGQGVYSSDWTDRTYGEGLRRAKTFLASGRRVLVDASFSKERMRRMFLDAAVKWGVHPVMLRCDAAANVARRRIESRRGDASDADWSVREAIAAAWDELADETKRFTHVVDANGTADESVAAAIDILRQEGLLGGSATSPPAGIDRNP